MSTSLKGLATVKKTLASGKTVYYCYAWRGGPLLKNSAGKPMQPHDSALAEAFARAHEQRRALTYQSFDADHTISWLFRLSPYQAWHPPGI